MCVGGGFKPNAITIVTLNQQWTILVNQMFIIFICTGTIFVLICSLIVHFANNENVTKYVDPIISIISGITLLVLSYPYSKYRISFFKFCNVICKFFFKLLPLFPFLLKFQFVVTLINAQCVWRI